MGFCWGRLGEYFVNWIAFDFALCAEPDLTHLSSWAPAKDLSIPNKVREFLHYSPFFNSNPFYNSLVTLKNRFLTKHKKIIELPLNRDRKNKANALNDALACASQPLRGGVALCEGAQERCKKEIPHNPVSCHKKHPNRNLWNYDYPCFLHSNHATFY